MNWLDWVLGLTLAFTIFRGAMRGFTDQVIGLAASLIGLMLGIWFYGTAGSIYEPYVSSKGIASFLGFLTVFFGILLLGTLVSFAVRRVLKATGIRWTDRVLGGAFGAVKGLLISLAIVTVFVAFAPGVRPGEAPKAVAESAVTPYVIDASNLLIAAAPRELKDAFRGHYESVKRVWADALEQRKK
jgi:membrane protein required for colicin V production